MGASAGNKVSVGRTSMHGIVPLYNTRELQL